MATAIARWQGEVDRTLRDHEADISDHDHRITGLDRRVSHHDVMLEGLAVKLGLAGMIGSLAGGGLVSAVVYLTVHS